MLEEEERKIREEEERIAAEQKLIEDEKERKRKLKADKIEAQKLAGTYMTKAEKEKEKKRIAKLESMRAAGLIPSDDKGGDGEENKVKQSQTYAKKKPNKATTNTKESVEAGVNDDADSAKNATASGNVANDDNEEEDDWESGNFVISNLTAKIGGLSLPKKDEEDDILVQEQKAEQERLKLLGIERLKREEEARIKK